MNGTNFCLKAINNSRLRTNPIVKPLLIIRLNFIYKVVVNY